MKYLIIYILIFVSGSVFAQIGLDYHLASYQFEGLKKSSSLIGINYEIKKRYRIEARSTVSFNSIEIMAAYDVLDKDNYEFYTGVGVSNDKSSGALIIPTGLNFYPFKNKNIGFQIELTPIIRSSFMLRDSFGIRYRFRKTNL